jgi:hypothetical protein
MERKSNRTCGPNEENYSGLHTVIYREETFKQKQKKVKAVTIIMKV